MSLERCKNCGVTMDNRDGSWIHQIRHFQQPVCINPEPGISLSEMVQQYWDNPPRYTNWIARSPDIFFTKNCILSALQQQAVIHWNNCANSCIARCEDVAQQHAITYMAQLDYGRHDLHPHDDSTVHMMAFEIHNALGSDHGRPGIMTCNYIGGPTFGKCDCYEQGYQKWLKKIISDKEKATMAATPINFEDMHYEPRFE